MVKESIITTPLEPSYKYNVNVRPVKYAYFFREGDKKSFERILRLVSTQWGGIHNLIIQVKKDLKIPAIYESFLRFHEPDRFVGYLHNLKAENPNLDFHNKFQVALNELWPRRIIHLEIGGDFFEEQDRTAHPLGVIPLDNLKESGALSIKELDPDDTMMSLALFGKIHDGQESDYAEMLTLVPISLKIGSREFWECQHQITPFSSVLNLTSFGISPYEVSGPFEQLHFDIIPNLSLENLSLFWNLRATREVCQFEKDMGRRTFLIPKGYLNNESLTNMLDVIRSNIAYPNIYSNLHINFIAWTGEDAKFFKKKIDKIEGLERLEEELSIGRRWNIEEPNKMIDVEGKNLTFRFLRIFLPQAYKEGVNHQIPIRTELSFGNNEVFFNPPGTIQNRGGFCSLDIECDVWQRYPKEKPMTDRILSNARFSKYGLSFAAYPHQSRPSYLNFALPSEWETIQAYFNSRGYDVRVSKPGVYSTAMLSLLGNIGDVKGVATKPAFLLLDKLSVKSHKKMAQRFRREIGFDAEQEEKFIDLIREVEITPELSQTPQSYKQLASLPAFRRKSKILLNLLSELGDKQVIKRGFALSCRACGTPSWHPLPTIAERMTCPGCSSVFEFPVEYPARSGQEIEWKYTLNTLVNRVMDQDTLPSLFALYRLTDGKQCSCLVPGIEIVQGGQIRAEFDFFFISGQEVYAGECKTGRKLGDKDLAAAGLAAEFGIHHYYFCTVRRFDRDSHKKVRTLKKELLEKNIPMSIETLNGKYLIGDVIE